MRNVHSALAPRVGVEPSCVTHVCGMNWHKVTHLSGRATRLGVLQGSGPVACSGQNLSARFCSRREVSVYRAIEFIEVLDGHLVGWCVGSVRAFECPIELAIFAARARPSAPPAKASSVPKAGVFLVLQRRHPRPRPNFTLGPGSPDRRNEPLRVLILPQR
jgi:hypothetical protein